ncbi:MAG: hypothetical protein Q9186_007369 [Xanthomendoza sp. 1 TL-2023]
MSPQRAKKLKETCDSCSASKVKCEKQWPQCSRCENLRYPCFYSPARRKGRPHPTITLDGRKKSEEPPERLSKQRKIEHEQDHPSPQAISCRIDEDYRTANAQDAFQREQQDHRGQPGINHRRDSAQSFRQENPTFPDLSNPSSQTFDTSSSTTNTSSPATFSPLTRASTMSSNTFLEDESSTWSPKSSYDDTNSDCPDCALLAMQSLQQLTTASSPPSHHFPHQDFTFESHLHTISTSLKRLSAILICPCSRNPNVGLLAAALCAAILDSYWSILQNSANYNPPSYHSIDSLFESIRSNQQAIIQRVLEELPKAANVVMQFTRRYSYSGTGALTMDGSEDVSLLLATLAVGQRTRLKDMIDKATSLLAMAV